MIPMDTPTTPTVTLTEARKAIVNPYHAGEIFYNSWGYDQTNIDFYIVTRVSRKCVWIREIPGVETEKSPGVMCGHTVPGTPESDLEPLRKTLQVYIDHNGEPSTPYISMPYGHSLRLWNGEPIAYSNDH